MNNFELRQMVGHLSDEDILNLGVAAVINNNDFDNLDQVQRAVNIFIHDLVRDKVISYQRAKRICKGDNV